METQRPYQLLYQDKRGAGIMRFLSFEELATVMPKLRRQADLRLNNVKVGGCDKIDGKWYWWYENNA